MKMLRLEESVSVFMNKKEEQEKAAKHRLKSVPIYGNRNQGCQPVGYHLTL